MGPALRALPVTDDGVGEREEGGIDGTIGGGRDSAAGTEAAHRDGMRRALHTHRARAKPIGIGGEGGGAAALSK